MVGVFDTNDNFALGLATTALTESGILHDVIRIPEVELNQALANPKWWIQPCRILVASEDELDARALLEMLQSPLGDSASEGMES
jgi:hypothetical protein